MVHHRCSGPWTPVPAARRGRRGSSAVEVFGDDGRDRPDLRPELLLDAEEVLLVVHRNKVDGQAEVPEAARAPHAVQIGL